MIVLRDTLVVLPSDIVWLTVIIIVIVIVVVVVIIIIRGITIAAKESLLFWLHASPFELQIVAEYSVKYRILIPQRIISNVYSLLHCEEESDDWRKDKASDEDEDVHEVYSACNSVRITLKKQPLNEDQPKYTANQQNWPKYYVSVSE